MGFKDVGDTMSRGVISTHKPWLKGDPKGAHCIGIRIFFHMLTEALASVSNKMLCHKITDCWAKTKSG